MDNTITIVNGDYGVTINMNIINGTPSIEDSFLITIKDTNNQTLIEKEYTGVTNTIPFSLTKEESELLQPILHYYSVDWYKDGVFWKNIVNGAKLLVKKKV